MRPRQSTRTKAPMVASPRAAQEPDGADPEMFAVGDKVRHAKFGAGMVVSVKPSGRDRELTVQFDGSAGIKRLLASFAPFDRVSDRVLRQM